MISYFTISICTFWIRLSWIKIIYLWINSHYGTAVSPAGHPRQLMAVEGVGDSQGAATVTLNIKSIILQSFYNFRLGGGETSL